MSAVNVLKAVCKGVEDCGICVWVCPVGLFEPSGEMNPAGYVPPQVKDEEKCTGCLSCILSCPDMAIVVTKPPQGKEADHE